METHRRENKLEMDENDVIVMRLKNIDFWI